MNLRQLTNSLAPDIQNACVTVALASTKRRQHAAVDRDAVSMLLLQIICSPLTHLCQLAQ